MQLDECVRLPADSAEIEQAMKLLAALGGALGKRAFEGAPLRPCAVRRRPGRRRSERSSWGEPARALKALKSFDGYAIGGNAMGGIPGGHAPGRRDDGGRAAGRRATLSHGTRYPSTDLLERPSPVESTCSTACCRRVTAATGVCLHPVQAHQYKNARHADDPRPLDPESRCPAARGFSPRLPSPPFQGWRGARQVSLLSVNNLFYYQDLVAGARAAIAAGRFAGVCDTGDGAMAGQA